MSMDRIKLSTCKRALALGSSSAGRITYVYQLSLLKATLHIICAPVYHCSLAHAIHSPLCIWDPIGPCPYLSLQFCVILTLSFPCRWRSCARIQKCLFGQPILLCFWMKRNRPLFFVFLNRNACTLCSTFYVIRGKWFEPTAISFWLKNIDVWPRCCGIASNPVDLVAKMKILLYDCSLFENEGWRACTSVWPLAL
jgi:hypothetical protein